MKPYQHSCIELFDVHLYLGYYSNFTFTTSYEIKVTLSSRSLIWFNKVKFDQEHLPRFSGNSILQGTKGLAKFGFMKYRFIFIYFTITGVKKIVHYMGDFIIQRLVILRFHCNAFI